jgi:hypothetical protein
MAGSGAARFEAWLVRFIIGFAAKANRLGRGCMRLAGALADVLATAAAGCRRSDPLEAAGQLR